MLLGLSLAIPQVPRKPAGGAAAPWTPLDLGAKLKGWLKADGLANGAVSSWTDSISGAAILQGVAGNQPQKSATSFNSAYPGVTFSTDDFLLLASVPTGWPTGTNLVEVWAVVDQKSLAADATARAFFGYGGGTTPTSVQLRRTSSAGTNRTQHAMGNGLLLDAVMNFSGPHITAGVGYGTTQESWGDGTINASAATTLGTTTARTVIGANLLAVPNVFAEICARHFFVIAGTLTTTASGEKDKLFGWCAWDSGLASLLPPAHPYKAAPP